jgi:hypothetical protein
LYKIFTQVSIQNTKSKTRKVLKIKYSPYFCLCCCAAAQERSCSCSWLTPAAAALAQKQEQTAIQIRTLINVPLYNPLDTSYVLLLLLLPLRCCARAQLQLAYAGSSCAKARAPPNILEFNFLQT